MGDGALMTALRETLAEARRRNGLKATLRQYLAEEVDELQMEMIAGSTLEPEAIVELCSRHPIAAKCDAAEAASARIAGTGVVALLDRPGELRAHGAGGRVASGESPVPTNIESVEARS